MFVDKASPMADEILALYMRRSNFLSFILNTKQKFIIPGMKQKSTTFIVLTAAKLKLCHSAYF